MALLRTSFLLLSSALLALPAMAYDNVVIVLDASGSMMGGLDDKTDKMQGATEAIKLVVGSLPESTRVGIVVFGASNQRDGWLYELGPRSDTKMFQSLDSLRPSGGTPLGRYLKMGADRLLTARTDEHGYGTYRLLVVTDGEANDQWKVEKFTPDIVQRGLSLDVIGVKMESDHTLKKSADSYRSADNPEQLIQAVREVFAEANFAGNPTLESAVFSDIDGLPDAFALSLLQTLSYGSSTNQPIGEKPPAPKAVESDDGPATEETIADRQMRDPPDCGTAPVPAGWLALGVGLLALRRRKD